jgi:hypothetical protein
MTATGLVLAWRLLPESPSWHTARIAGNIVPGMKLSLREIGPRWPLLAAYLLLALVLYLLLRGVIPALVDRPQDMGRLMSWLSIGSLSGSMLLLILLWKLPCSQIARYTLMLAAVVLLAGSVNPFFTVTQPLMLFSAGLFLNAGRTVLWALTIIALPVAVRGAGTGLLVLLVQTADPIASPAGVWLGASTPGLMTIWVLMGLACLVGAWLVRKYFGQRLL